ncbi:MAG TPA: SRPBCC domain-containing protein [Acidimicrobiales bacterium]|nr:SRPBCC domain-containing protein [Acidimicrobiales bacterium]
MTDATIEADGDRAAVRLERTLADPPAVVWRALTEPDELARWFPCRIVIDGGVWRVGAKLEFPFPAHVIDMTLVGEILHVDEPHALAYTWGDETLRFELHEHDGGTLLVLVDLLERPHAARNAAGWEDCLDHLQAISTPSDSWRARFERYTAAFEPTLGPQEGPPEGYKGG